MDVYSVEVETDDCESQESEEAKNPQALSPLRFDQEAETEDYGSDEAFEIDIDSIKAFYQQWLGEEEETKSKRKRARLRSAEQM